MEHFLYIIWNPDLFLFHIGSWGVRWYSLCWLIGLASAFFIVKWLFDDQKITFQERVYGKEKTKINVFDPLFIYCFFGILIGARLGHCIFYQPEYFLTSADHIIEMFLPIHHMPDGSWKYIGYEGLASHGGTIGLMIALWLYCRNYKVKLWTVLDNIAIATPITACFIRLGNLMNSEIIGKVTDVPWAFIFYHVDQYPRHPGQLYEAIAYAFFFFVGLHFYCRTKKPVGTGFYFGLCITLIFAFRFFIEYTKDIQVDFEAGMPFNMGQILSIPFVILGIYCMIRSRKIERLKD
jgi:phosphatidylglycerol:prolipoprotein diacylglycerol transferase